MKKLIFVRHGKAEEALSGISDYERSLTHKGKIVSRIMARRLRENEDSTLKVVASPAFRALETALIFAGECGVDPHEIIIDSRIYFRLNLKILPDILSPAADGNDTVVIFGHNPSITEIADSLCTEGFYNMAKSAILSLVFDIRSWKELKHGSGRKEYYLQPD